MGACDCTVRRSVGASHQRFLQLGHPRLRRGGFQSLCSDFLGIEMPPGDGVVGSPRTPISWARRHNQSRHGMTCGAVSALHQRTGEVERKSRRALKDESLPSLRLASLPDIEELADVSQSNSTSWLEYKAHQL